jgi:hypothetical protein
MVFPAIFLSVTSYGQNAVINSSPTLHPIEDLTVKSTGDTRFIALTGITAGDESEQFTNISVSSTNSELITLLEADQTSNGQAFIRYRLKPGATGSVNIRVLVTDNGMPAAETSRIFNLTVESAATYSPPPVKTMPATTLKSEKSVMLKAYPNPFPSNATVSFSTPEDEQHVSLDIYHFSGVKVQKLYSGSTAATQKYTVPVNRANLSPGIYILRLTTSRQTEQLKLVVAQ